MIQLPPPIGIQADFCPPSASDVRSEYLATFHDTTTHLPEVFLRYVILLVIERRPLDEIEGVVLMLRSELNEQKLQASIRLAGLADSTVPTARQVDLFRCGNPAQSV